MTVATPQPRRPQPRSLQQASLLEAPTLLFRRIRGLSSNRTLTWLACIPIALLGLAGMVSAQALREFRRYAIVGIFVVAAVVTPPDPISQLMLALPIILLYEISIWCVRIIEFRRRDEPSDDVIA